MVKKFKKYDGFDFSQLTEIKIAFIKREIFFIFKNELSKKLRNLYTTNLLIDIKNNAIRKGCIFRKYLLEQPQKKFCYHLMHLL